MFELTLSQALGMSSKKEKDPLGASKLNKVSYRQPNLKFFCTADLLEIMSENKLLKLAEKAQKS